MRHFRAGTDGIIVELRPEERNMLSSVLQQFREVLLDGKDPSLMRLRPPVHLNDPDASADFWRMTGDSLLSHQLEAIETAENSLGEQTLDEQTFTAWLHSLNSVRLYLGSSLEVGAVTFEPPSEETDTYEAHRYIIYEWLGGLIHQLVQAAAKCL